MTCTCKSKSFLHVVGCSASAKTSANSSLATETIKRLTFEHDEITVLYLAATPEASNLQSNYFRNLLTDKDWLCQISTLNKHTITLMNASEIIFLPQNSASELIDLPAKTYAFIEESPESSMISEILRPSLQNYFLVNNAKEVV